MAIIQLFDNEQLPEYVRCAICGKQIPMTEATAGLLDAEQQQFACNGHFWNPHQFIIGWADFMATQRQGQKRKQFITEYGGTTDVRLMR
jgi:hypothetical protein